MKDSQAFERLKRAVIARTGHAYYEDKDRLLHERIRERMSARGVASLEAYERLLELAEETEWRALEDVITIGETYFFRYPDHFAALRNEVLPDLIAARHESRTLRIWCIGCANGAEPYSIAILLRELLGDAVDTWRIALIGGDISERALAQARSARYGAWALRTLGPAERAAYFDKDGAVWVLKSMYRGMVRFERQNLLDLLSPTPPLAWNGFDLILCRNVLIYFSPQQAIAVTRELGRRIKADGLLLLGHAEATLAAEPGLVFATPLASEFGQAIRPATEPPRIAPYTPPILPDLPQPPPIVSSVPDAIAPISVAQVENLADAGDYEAAMVLSRRLIAAHPMSPQLRYYDAVLRQVTDDVAGAESELRRAIYLDPAFVLAHHRLGLLLLGRGLRKEARRSLLTALRHAEAARPETQLPEGRGIDAGTFTAMLRGQIEAFGEAA